jgi:hypothetical protein
MLRAVYRTYSLLILPLLVSLPAAWIHLHNFIQQPLRSDTDNIIEKQQTHNGTPQHSPTQSARHCFHEEEKGRQKADDEAFLVAALCST